MMFELKLKIIRCLFCVNGYMIQWHLTLYSIIVIISIFLNSNLMNFIMWSQLWIPYIMLILFSWSRSNIFKTNYIGIHSGLCFIRLKKWIDLLFFHTLAKYISINVYVLKVDNSIVIVVYKEWMKLVYMSYISIHIYSHWLIFEVLSFNI